MTGTSVVAIKYKDGILMVADLGGQWEILSILLCLRKNIDDDCQHVYHFSLTDS